MSVWNIHSWPAVTLASLAMSTYQFHDPPELHLFVIAVAWEGRLRLWSDGHLGPWVDTASWILLCSWPRDYLWQEFVADVRAGADAAERWILNVCSKYVSSTIDVEFNVLSTQWPEDFSAGDPSSDWLGGSKTIHYFLRMALCAWV